MARYHDEDVLRELYWEKGMSLKEIGEKFDTGSTTINTWMKKNGIDRRTAAQDKPVHYRTDDSGYERWRHNTNGIKYGVAVHRLVKVAEEGLEAVKGMEVHHKNRIPWDNRPSNLELVTPQEHREITGEQNKIDAADISDEKLREYIYGKSMSINDIAEAEDCKKLAVERSLEQSPVWRRFLPQRDNQIVVYVVENNSIEFAADYFDLAEDTIKQRLYAAERNDLIPTQRTLVEDEFSKEKLQRLYHEEDYTQQDIADKFDVTSGYISQLFSRFDISASGRGPEKHSRNDSFLGEDMEQPWQEEEILREEYVENNNGYRVLSDAWGCSQSTIQKWVEKFGFEKNDPTDYIDEPWHDEDTLREMYHEQQMTQQEIADELGCSTGSINTWMKRHGIEARTTGETLKMK
jgi:uncharacterized protein YjcR